MKRIVVLLMLLLIVPPMTALAASVTSKSFVVRNWRATPASTEPLILASTEEPVDEQAGEIEPEENGAAETRDRSDKPMDEPDEPGTPVDMFIPPELGSTAPAPAFTDEVEPEETEEHGEPEGEEPGEADEQGEFVGEVEGQGEQPVDDQSGEEELR